MKKSEHESAIQESYGDVSIMDETGEVEGSGERDQQKWGRSGEVEKWRGGVGEEVP